MNKEFVKYEEALALKDLGFDYTGLASYSDNDTFNIGGFYYKTTPCDDKICIAPLYQQAFRWFREKHNLLHELNSVQKDSWLITIWETSSTTKNGVYNGKRWDLDDLDENIPHTYEEAELACLNKLIEIVKNK